MNKLLNSISRIGLKKTIRKAILKLLGISAHEESIDALFYYLNNYIVDVSKLPPTKDQDLRIMQKCDAALLIILDRICKKYNLTYWLDFGTLLGAQRHKGFIPWDDEMDVAMLREDYNKLLSILKIELNDNNFDILALDGRIGFGYKHSQTGIWCDIFPVDQYKSNEEFSLAIKQLKKQITKYRKFYLKNRKKYSSQVLEQKRNVIIENAKDFTYSIIYHGREFNHEHPNAFYLEHEIFPLTTINFENHKFPAPNNIDLYLKKIYGLNYMHLPKTGILHHGMGRGALSTWAKNNHIDMNNLYNYLSNYK